MAVTVDKTKFNHGQNPTGSFAAVTPADDTEVLVKGRYPRKIFVGVGGDVNLYNDEGVAVLFKNVPNGWSEIISFTGVADTSTDATDIIAIG